MNYDGSINIDTRVDTKGIKKGTSNITQQLGGVMKAVKGVGAALGLAFSGAAIFGFIKKTLESFDLMSSSVGGQIKELKQSFELFKGAVANAFVAAFAALAPYIITVVNWLTTMLTTLAQIITALFGVQNAMKGVTQNTKESAKAAKGALAAFDQINVLSQNKDENAGSELPVLSIPTGLLEKVQAFKDAMLKFLQPVIDALGNLYEALKPLGKTIWEGLKWAWENILMPLGNWVISDLVPAFLELLAGAADVLNEALIALAPLAQEFFDNFLAPLAEWAGSQIIEFLGWLTEKLHELAEWIKENPEKFQDFVAIVLILAAVFKIAGLIIAGFGIAISATVLSIIALFALLAVAIYLLITHWDELSTTVEQLVYVIGFYIFQLVQTVISKFAEMWEMVQNIWAGVGDWFAENVTDPIRETFAQVWESIQDIWGNVYTWFTENVTDPIREAFAEMLFNVASGFLTVFNGIRDFISGIVNSIIDIINGLFDAILGGMNLIGEGANGLGAIVGGGNKGSETLAPRIPRLATGAVIPPNSEFAAILGDQRGGRNLEAPEGLIRQIIREEMQGSNGGNITVTFEGSLGALVRELKPHIDFENKRRGNSLVKVGSF
jgi:hypothetical protein